MSQMENKPTSESLITAENLTRLDTDTVPEEIKQLRLLV